jgi:hypothetical protein
MENEKSQTKDSRQDLNSDTVAQNKNPRANENIRIRTEEPKSDPEAENEVGSEITDGEDA